MGISDLLAASALAGEKPFQDTNDFVGYLRALRSKGCSVKQSQDKLDREVLDFVKR